MLSHVFTVARKEWHWVSHNPFDGVGKLREGRGRVRFLSEEERTTLLRETVKDRGAAYIRGARTFHGRASW